MEITHIVLCMHAWCYDATRAVIHWDACMFLQQNRYLHALVTLHSMHGKKLCIQWAIFLWKTHETWVVLVCWLQNVKSIHENSFVVGNRRFHHLSEPREQLPGRCGWIPPNHHQLQWSCTYPSSTPQIHTHKNTLKKHWICWQRQTSYLSDSFL